MTSNHSKHSQKKSEKQGPPSVLILLGILIIGIFIGVYASPYVLPQNASGSHAGSGGHDHQNDLLHSHDTHTHESLEVTADEIPPEVDLEIVEDPQGKGWNLQITYENFQISPEKASTAHVEGEGHAHLYIGGEKITRIYSGWYHIPELSKGSHEIMITLNSNDHKQLTFEGQPIQDTETITVS